MAGDLIENYQRSAEDRDYQRMVERMGDGIVSQAEQVGDCLTRVLDKARGAIPDNAGNATALSFVSSEVAKRMSAWDMEKGMDHARRQVANVSDLCESPIERKLLPWLLCEDYGPNLNGFCAMTFNHKRDLVMPTCRVVVAPQFALLRYRLDFAVFARRDDLATRIIAVECDGQEFHGKASDDKRDAALRSIGVQTIRADGSDCTLRPRAVTRRVSELVQEWLN